MSPAVSEDVETVCAHCGEKFNPKRFWQKFCSGRCRRGAWDRMNPRQRIVAQQLQRIESKLDALASEKNG
jgi:hypothetical protein